MKIDEQRIAQLKTKLADVIVSHNKAKRFLDQAAKLEEFLRKRKEHLHCLIRSETVQLEQGKVKLNDPTRRANE